MVVSQALYVVSHMMVDGCGATYGPGDVYAARVGANDNVLPSIDQDAVDAVAMQHAYLRFVGIEQQRTTSSTVTPHLIYTFAVDTNQHGLVVVWTDAADGVLGFGVVSQTNEHIGCNGVVVA